MISRRAAIIGVATAACRDAQALKPQSAPLDHIVWLSANRDAAVDLLFKATGLEAAPGGEHGDGGTHNAVVRLGETSYLEVISPMPGVTQGNLYVSRAAKRPKPHIAGWCIRPREDLDLIAARLRSGGVQSVGPFPMSRMSPGGRIDWRLLVPNPPRMAGLAPFLIAWGDMDQHPARGAVSHGRLKSFEAGHPNPPAVGRIFERLNIDLPVGASQTPSLRATVEGPRGTLLISS